MEAFINFITTCSFRQKNEDQYISNYTVYDNDQGLLDQEEANQKMKSSGHDFRVFDFDNMKKYFQEQFQLNEEIEIKYSRKQSEVQQQKMFNSKLKQIEDFERQSVSVRNFQLNSDTQQQQVQYNIKEENEDIDFNLISDDKMLEILKQGLEIINVLKSKNEKEKLKQMMLENIKKVNKDHQKVDIESIFQLNQEDGGICLDKGLMEAQRNLISFLIKEVGTSIFKGKSLHEVSLPINIFEAETILTRLSKSFLYYHILSKSINFQNPLHIFKSIMASVISSCSLSLSQRKPFNSANGETHSAFIVDTENQNIIHFQAEQVSHYPPISYIHITGDRFRMFGNLCLETKIKFNSVIGNWKSNLRVQILDKENNVSQDVIVLLPQFKVGGTVWGTRTFNFDQQAYFLDLTNNFYGQINFGEFVQKMNRNERYNDCLIDGFISKISDKFKQNFVKKHKGYQQIETSDLKKQEVIQEICKIKGNWSERIEIDGKEYWNRQKSEQGLYLVDNCALPSDSIFRHDIYYLRLCQSQNAQLAKDQIEAVQKKDKVLRINSNKK